jgi:hypothetical protein
MMTGTIFLFDIAVKKLTELIMTTNINSVALVGGRSMPTERPPLVDEVSANYGR